MKSFYKKSFPATIVSTLLSFWWFSLFFFFLSNTLFATDYNIKLKKIKSFILGGDKTKISVRFRGREILNSDMGLNLLKKLRDELIDIAQVDQEPSLEGRQLLMVLSPLKKKN